VSRHDSWAHIEHPTCVQCACVCANTHKYTHVQIHTNTPTYTATRVKDRKTQDNTSTSPSLKNNPPRQATSVLHRLVTGRALKYVLALRTHVCELLCFIKPILGNRYVWSRGFIVSEPRETHPPSEIANVPTSPCPPLDNLGCPDPHPSPWLRRWLHWSPPLPLRMDLQLLRWQPGACGLAAPSSGQVQSSFGLIGEGTESW